MIIINLLSTVGDVNVTDDCCTVKVAVLVVIESNIYHTCTLVHYALKV